MGAQEVIERAEQTLEWAPASARTTERVEGEEALATWREKLDFLLQEEAVEADADQRFKLRKRIEEARRKVRELDDEPTEG